MTLMEKLEALSAEQRQKFDAVATEHELDAFLRETEAELTAEETASAWRYIQARQVKTDGGQSGKAELADEELDNVAGGVSSGSGSTYQEMAAIEGRTMHVPIGDGFWFCEFDSQLCECIEKGVSVYAKSKDNIPTGIGYSDCKCYQCNKTWRAIGGIV